MHAYTWYLQRLDAEDLGCTYTTKKTARHYRYIGSFLTILSSSISCSLFRFFSLFFIYLFLLFTYLFRS
ncbi:hypothetical protein GE21DRAFT_1107740 [Neurospora crassa]|nr:hypothetical protein GE21DRAFT_1107740 [Neurospora crassa]